MKPSILPIFLAGILLVGCHYPMKLKVEEAKLNPGGPQAWIDAPLDGMHLPLATPYEVVFHITDDSGVSRGELSVNGQVMGLLLNPQPDKKLATLRQMWSPPAPGEYLLQARAQNSSGAWSEYASVRVYVGENTQTTTPTFTLTTTPLATITPTVTATTTQPVALSFSPGISTNTLFYGGCQPNTVDIQVQVSGGGDVHGVVLFVRLKDQASADKTDWNSYKSMTSKGGGVFSVTVASDKIPDYQKFAKSNLMYQFVATDKNRNILGRSEVYSDISLEACGFAPPPGLLPPPSLFIFSTPTLTPVIVK